ncbi:MAG: hypothetical protein P1U61_04350 [Legionellaceae bacterium]|nr:hypothetical protein [Legionellaceae bacterium]
MKSSKKSLLGALSLLLSMGAFAGTTGEASYTGFSLDSLKLDKLKEDTSWLLHIGGFISHQGMDQHININGAVGNEYNATKKNSGNVIVGVGLLRPAVSYKAVDVEYGVQLYYLPSTTTGGNIEIENVLPNLSYKYATSFLPLYANLKLNIDTQMEKTKLTVDFGIGPDFMTFSSYHEKPLTNSTIPNSFFSRTTSTQFATLFGVGLKSDKYLNNSSLELAYRFFYLGGMDVSPNNNQVLTNFKTGPIYANAITLSVRT